MKHGKPTLGVIGAGKVGVTFARLLHHAGYRICAVYNRSADRALALAQAVGAQAASHPAEVVLLADLTLVTVADDAITTVAEMLDGHDLRGKGIVHTSGAHDATSLAVPARRGAMTGSFHPAFPFADVEVAMRALAGASFAIEAEAQQLEVWLRGLVEAFKGSAVVIPPGGKATYHLALAIASTYIVTLYSIGERLLLSLGTERAAADNALNTLVEGTVENLRQQGVPKAMVGPLTRVDVGTIAAHLQVLRKTDSQLVDVYKGLARLSYPMLEARNIPTAPIEKLMQQEEEDARHNP